MLELINKLPFDANAWPGNWVWTQDSGDSFEVVQFCRWFTVNDILPAKLHISADNRYKLYIDGIFVGLGPQRGTLDRYFFDTYDLSNIKPGEHIFSAVVWHERDTAPSAQISSRPGFLAVVEDADGKMSGPLETWKYKRWHGNGTIPVPEDAYCIGVGYDMTGFTLKDTCPAREVLEKEFVPVKALGYSRNHKQGHHQLLMQWNLHPRTIPALKAEKHNLGCCRRVIMQDITIHDDALQNKISSLAQCPSDTAKVITIPAHSRYKILLDQGNLVAGYPTILVSGGCGTSVDVTYQEGLQSTDDVRSKGNRNEVGDRILVGITDRFRLEGKRDVILEPFWWRCWRYMELDIQTSDQPLELNALSYRSTGYPLELKAKFEADGWFDSLIEPGFRTMELCAGETYMDCPYYEQLQYIGDARIMALLSYVLCNDDRLGCEAITMFDLSRGSNGLPQSNFPCRNQNPIPLFSLVYIAMLNDFLMWRGNIAFVQERLVGVENKLKAFERCTKDNGLIGKVPGVGNMPGWAFVDWADLNKSSADAGWKNGEPPAASQGNSFLVSFFYLYALQQAANIYDITGDKKSADQIRQKAANVQNVLCQVAFDTKRQIFIDDPSGLYLSQHTNIFAILTDTYLGVVDGKVLLENILNDVSVAKATVYFKFYLFEAMYHLGRADLIWPDLKLWHDMLDNGLTTFAEKPAPSRSDCHAWSSHPLYHFIASILGVRPSAPGCSVLSIKPISRTKSVVQIPESLGAKFNTVKGECYIGLTAYNDKWKIKAKVPSGVELATPETLD